MIVRTPERLDPCGSATMLAGARSTRNLPIRDIANEDVAERMLRFVRNGRLPSALHDKPSSICMHSSARERERPLTSPPSQKTFPSTDAS